MGLRKVRPLTWSSEDVGTWLTSLGLANKIEAFQNEEVDGFSLFDLSEEDLEAGLITTIGARKKFLR